MKKKKGGGVAERPCVGSIDFSLTGRPSWGVGAAHSVQPYRTCFNQPRNKGETGQYIPLDACTDVVKGCHTVPTRQKG
jgi:hypothetical protein